MAQDSSIHRILSVASQRGLEWHSTAHQQVVAPINGDLLLVLTREIEHVPLVERRVIMGPGNYFEPVPTTAVPYVRLDVRELDPQGEPTGRPILTADARNLPEPVAKQLTELWFEATEAAYAPAAAADRVLKALGG